MSSITNWLPFVSLQPENGQFCGLFNIYKWLPPSILPLEHGYNPCLFNYKIIAILKPIVTKQQWSLLWLKNIILELQKADCWFFNCYKRVFTLISPILNGCHPYLFNNYKTVSDFISVLTKWPKLSSPRSIVAHIQIGFGSLVKLNLQDSTPTRPPRWPSMYLSKAVLLSRFFLRVS